MILCSCGSQRCCWRNNLKNRTFEISLYLQYMSCVDALATLIIFLPLNLYPLLLSNALVEFI